MRTILGPMIFANFIIALGLLLHAIQANAHTPAEGKIWATLGPYLYRTYTPHAESDRALVGAALLVEGDVDKNGGVEIAAFYLDKLYFREQNGGLAVEKIKRMYITTGYRHWFTTSLSAGLAFFSSYSMGDARVIHNGLPDNATTETSARDITEYGFDGSLQWEIWGTENFAVLADTRYSLSMTRKSQENADVYGFFLGLKYHIPKKAE